MSEDLFEEMFRRFLIRDKTATETVINAVYPRLYRFAMALVSDESQAQDIVQESFVILFQKSGKLNCKSSDDLFRWMCGVAWRKWDHLRRRRRGEQSTPTLDELASNGVSSNPYTKAAETEEVAIVKEAILTLPLEFRDVLLLHCFAELSIEQIAEVIGLTRSGVRTRLCRARQQLRAAVGPRLPSLIERMLPS